MALVGPIVLMLLDERHGMALLLIFIAGFSDGLDGFLAKRYDWRSRLGGILDPLADKLLLVSAFITLSVTGLVPAWLTMVVIFRDVTIVSGGLAYQALIERVQPEPSRVSKFNTGAQLMFLLASIGQDGYGMPGRAVVIGLGALVLVTAVVSGMDYVLRWSRKAQGAMRNAATG